MNKFSFWSLCKLTQHISAKVRVRDRMKEWCYYHLWWFFSHSWWVATYIPNFTYMNLYSLYSLSLRRSPGASLMAQWKRICLPLQETGVRSLVREDLIWRGATKPMHHNFWACAVEPSSCNYWVHESQLLKPLLPRARAPQEKPLQWEAFTPQLESSPYLRQLEKSSHSDKDPAQPKINKTLF